MTVEAISPCTAKMQLNINTNSERLSAAVCRKPKVVASYRVCARFGGRVSPEKSIEVAADPATSNAPSKIIPHLYTPLRIPLFFSLIHSHQLLTMDVDTCIGSSLHLK